MDRLPLPTTLLFVALLAAAASGQFCSSSQRSRQLSNFNSCLRGIDRNNRIGLNTAAETTSTLLRTECNFYRGAKICLRNLSCYSVSELQVSIIPNLANVYVRRAQIIRRYYPSWPGHVDYCNPYKK